jgi:Ser/Thr protein kinase RdoA (MazF antagonist)
MRQGMICSWLPGVTLGRRVTLPNVERQGALMAQMHTCAAAYTLPEDFQVKAGDCLYPFEPFILNDPAYLTELEDSVRDHVARMIPFVENALARLRTSGAAMCLLHGDLHQWNVMIFRDTVYALDFDDLLLGYPVQDIGISLFYYRLRENFAEIHAAFRRGYEAVRPWPESYPGEVETWITWRALTLLNGVLWSQDPEDRYYIPYCVNHLMGSAQGLKAFGVTEIPVKYDRGFE